MFGIDQGAYILAGVIITQGVVVFGIVYAAHNAKKARVVAESTNNAVNHVPEGTPTLIQQVQEHGRILQKHGAYHEWQTDVLREVARQAGVVVPPLPAVLDDEKETAA